MAKFRKKPVVVEAEVYQRGLETGWEFEDNLTVDPTSAMFAVSRLSEETSGVRVYPYLVTLEGKQYLSEGDYIITGVQGERYPCKSAIFEQTYEPTEKEAPPVQTNEETEALRKELQTYKNVWAGFYSFAGMYFIVISLASFFPYQEQNWWLIVLKLFNIGVGVYLLTTFSPGLIALIETKKKASKKTKTF